MVATMTEASVRKMILVRKQRDRRVVNLLQGHPWADNP
jgi:hypothetical protein